MIGPVVGKVAVVGRATTPVGLAGGGSATVVVVVVGGRVVVVVEVVDVVDVVDVVEVVDVELVDEVDVEVDVDVVSPVVAGIVIVMNASLAFLLNRSTVTRTWQFVKSGPPLVDGGSPGAKQLNFAALPAGDAGSGPLNGKKPKFGSFAGNVAMPSAPTSTEAGDVAVSQWSIGFQPGAEGATPSHCSMFVVPTPCGNPDATTVNDNGLPAASPGTRNGLEEGVVIVPANAAPRPDSTTTAVVAATN
jgi:hypothetical protein